MNYLEANTKTMTSREIAAIVEKRHDNVKGTNMDTKHNIPAISDSQQVTEGEVVHINLADILKPCIFDDGKKYVYIVPLPAKEDEHFMESCSACYGKTYHSEMCERLQDQCGCCEGGISDFYGISVYYHAPAEALRAIANQAEPSNIREMNFNRSFKECIQSSDFYKNRNNKKGFVYFASSSESGSVKIGSSRNVKSRMSQLSTSSPSRIYPIFSLLCEDRLSAERSLHRHFSKKRMNGEWFDLSGNDIALAKSKEFLKSIGIDVIEIMDGLSRPH